MATEAGSLPVGTRLEVLWTHPTRWELGTVVRLDRRLERGSTAVRYEVAYDDGTSSLEDLREVKARLANEEESWTKVSLRCCLTFERLVDPARGDGCLHPPRCNYHALATELRSTVCPVSGCGAKVSRRAIVRDEAYKRLLAAVPTTRMHAWYRPGCDAMRLRPPHEDAAALDVDGRDSDYDDKSDDQSDSSDEDHDDSDAEIQVDRDGSDAEVLAVLAESDDDSEEDDETCWLPEGSVMVTAAASGHDSTHSPEWDPPPPSLPLRHGPHPPSPRAQIVPEPLERSYRPGTSGVPSNAAYACFTSELLAKWRACSTSRGNWHSSLKSQIAEEWNRPKTPHALGLKLAWQAAVARARQQPPALAQALPLNAKLDVVAGGGVRLRLVVNRARTARGPRGNAASEIVRAPSCLYSSVLLRLCGMPTASILPPAPRMVAAHLAVSPGEGTVSLRLSTVLFLRRSTRHANAGASEGDLPMIDLLDDDDDDDASYPVVRLRWRGNPNATASEASRASVHSIACAFEGCGTHVKGKKAYKEHARVAHPGWAPFRCPVEGCDVGIWGGHIQRHIQLCHDGGGRHDACSFCGHLIPQITQSNVLAHMRKCHQSPGGVWVRLALRCGSGAQQPCPVGARLTVITTRTGNAAGGGTRKRALEKESVNVPVAHGEAKRAKEEAKRAKEEDKRAKEEAKRAKKEAKEAERAQKAAAREAKRKRAFEEMLEWAAAREKAKKAKEEEAEKARAREAEKARQARELKCFESFKASKKAAALCCQKAATAASSMHMAKEALATSQMEVAMLDESARQAHAKAQAAIEAVRQAQALAQAACAAAAGMQAAAHVARQKTLGFAALTHQKEREAANAEDAKKRAVWELAEAERTWQASRSGFTASSLSIAPAHKPHEHAEPTSDFAN